MSLRSRVMAGIALIAVVLGIVTVSSPPASVSSISDRNEGTA